MGKKANEARFISLLHCPSSQLCLEYSNWWLTDQWPCRHVNLSKCLGYSTTTPNHEEQKSKGTPRYSGTPTANGTPMGHFGDATPLYDEWIKCTHQFEATLCKYNVTRKTINLFSWRKAKHLLLRIFILSLTCFVLYHEGWKRRWGCWGTKKACLDIFAFRRSNASTGCPIKSTRELISRNV